MIFESLKAFFNPLKTLHDSASQGCSGVIPQISLIAKSMYTYLLLVIRCCVCVHWDSDAATFRVISPISAAKSQGFWTFCVKISNFFETSWDHNFLNFWISKFFLGSRNIYSSRSLHFRGLFSDFLICWYLYRGELLRQIRRWDREK